MGLFNLFRKKNMSNEIKEYLEKGAVVLDVRTIPEWNEGHSEGAKHIVLDTIPNNVEEIKSWNKPVIAVCRSGARSGQATEFLNGHGVDVINGGPWQNVDQHL
ncbi:Rhodanese-like domain-containing protein [Tenacibaculum sp. MAR_2009_124]|uniref:rhodanese-like domain-containing protein n=1 Tax=Tenacibaculum sp. MAR_2009_124 TaxID=1250059 RepID=UPI00089AC2EC|nr:rhodanese-like domain-containing protein [Tenacibaculum sp. MAR_2009_124]SED18439.1 Rhodanese-like domain-containing protein [Tenacibaculum sp. MAR_2009_124]